MRETVERLIEIETLSSDVYRRAAKALKADTDLSALLLHLAADEERHHVMLESVLKKLKESEENPLCVSFDDRTRDSISSFFIQCKNKLDDDTLVASDMVNCILSTEYSEWNDIFIYVIRLLLSDSRDFISGAAEIEQHKRSIERFLEGRSEYSGQLDLIRLIPDVWNEKILVIEENRDMQELLKAILVREGEIVIAASIEEAKALIKDEYFAVIVTELFLSHTSGSEFYEEAKKHYPDFAARMLVLADYLEPRDRAFLEEAGIRYLKKPAPVSEIKAAVAAILYDTDDRAGG